MKPCPFCGTEDAGRQETEDRQYDQVFAYVRCWKCNARGPAVPVGRYEVKWQEAIDAWNQRPELIGDRVSE